MAESNRAEDCDVEQTESEGSPDSQQATVVNYFQTTFQNVGIVQMGENNSVLNQASGFLPDSKEGNPDYTKNDMFVALVTSILNPTSSSKVKEMKLSELEKKVNNLFTEMNDKKTTFKDVHGKPLQHFIERNLGKFELMNKKGVLFVKSKLCKVKSRKRSTKNTDEHKLSGEVKQIFQTEKTSEDLLERKASHKTPCDTGDTNNEWKKKLSKRDKRMMNDSQGNSSESTLDCSSYDLQKPDIQSSINKRIVEELLWEKEGNQLIFYPDDKIYKCNLYKFMQDVVSMWNTPSRHKSFIVLGVKCQTDLPHKVIGLDVSSGNDFYQSLFLPECFTMRPQYQYIQYTYEEKLVGVITVSSSHGNGSPSVVKTSTYEPDFLKGQLWARFNKENRVIPPEDFFTGQIYHWFISTSTSSDIKSCPVSVSKESNVSQIDDKTTQTTLKQRQQSSESRCENITDFASAVDHFKKGHFVLVSGESPKISKHLEKLALVPWISVYDFDKYSRDNGLLSCLEDVIKKKRHVHVCTWKTSAANLTETGTQWCGLRGFREIPDSDTSEDPVNWFKEIKSGLDFVCINLARFAECYTVLKIIILWPDDEVRAQYVYKFMCQLFGYLGPAKLIIVCFEEPKTEASKSLLMLLINEHKKDTLKLTMHQDELCFEVENMFDSSQVGTQIKYTLPKQEGHSNCYIDDMDAAWLREDMDVLYESNPYTPNTSDVDVLRDEADCFFHGGTIHWFAWYELGTGLLDVERDIMNNIIDHINQKCKKEYRSVIITIFHAPGGGGGTTLAQRILWELHRSIPCTEVKKRATIDGLADKITFLHEKSNLPVLVLVDGDDETRVKQLAKSLNSVFAIFLYVKRYPYQIPSSSCRPRDNRFWLDGKVSGTEAKKLALRFGDRCHEESKKQKLCNMSKEVCDKGKYHYVFEFGMAVYFAEFKGIASYVKGYLDLENNPKHILLPWQKVLAYLSLVYYYGQSSMPCQIFAHLLNKPSNFDVDIDDFQYPVSAFVVQGSSNGRTKDIRICHYLVAKEILEHILNRNQKYHRAEGLTSQAKRGLKDLCLEFIAYASHKKLKSSLTAGTIMRILTQTFIFRDNKDVGENVTRSKKPLFSQIMNDIDSDAPFTGRLEVLEKLTSSFPGDPNFQAHLGRFYAHCRPDEDGKAEACFKRALELCKKQSLGKGVNDLDDGMKSTLMHIYHMYGTIYKRKVSRYTGRTPVDKPEIRTSAEQFMSRAEHITFDAETACTYFAQSREHKPKGHDEIYNYAFSSEIMVRLHVCDFVERNYENGGISDFLSEEADHPTAKFIRETVRTVEDLIVECYSDIDTENIDTEFGKALFWYQSLFKSHSSKLEEMFSDDEVSSRRLKIASIKLKYLSNVEGTSSVFEGNSMLGNDVKKVVDLYEINFKDAKRYGETNKRQLDGDYKEWLFAIRNPKFDSCYSIEKVLLDIRDWHEMVPSPASMFYLFICTSLVGFGTKFQKGISETLVEAQILKEELQKLSKSVLRPRYPREWLGKDENGIKCLISNRIVGHIDGGHMKGASSMLAVCKGSICHPNKNPLSGYIDLDLGNNSVSVRTFFIPVRAELQGARYAGERVQFHLAFSLVHGYEAFGVLLLKKYPCSVCELKIEIPKEEDSVQCSSCGNLVRQIEPAAVEEMMPSIECD